LASLGSTEALFRKEKKRNKLNKCKCQEYVSPSYSITSFCFLCRMIIMTQMITDNEQGLGGSQQEGFLASSSFGFVVCWLPLVLVGGRVLAELRAFKKKKKK
jgi:hypothetical protein